MRSARRSRTAVALTAVVSTSALVLTGLGSSAVAAKDPSAQSRKFRKAVTPGGIGLHLDALQNIANANGGNRASGTPGYAASRDYVVNKLRAAGYKPRVQSFAFPYFGENSPAELDRVSPTPKRYVEPGDFVTMTFSGTGEVTANVVAVDTDLTPSDTSTSGCEASDFANFPSGAIALVQRGTCTFAAKADNAARAGAGAVLIFNRGTGGNTASLSGTLGVPASLPVLGTSFAAGQELGQPNTVTHVKTDTDNADRTTYNIVAETRRGNPDRVVMAGAHLDSVEKGPGLNDNGSGSATILEIAEQMAKVKKLRNTVRFAWWGAEELGLLGAQHYVNDLVENDPQTLREIGAYLNYDMIGSPNYVRFVYDGDNSLGEGARGPAGSGDIEALFENYFTSQRLVSEETAFDGRSDYGPFIANGVASGGLFSGAEDIKTAAQARRYGGVAGAAYDVCYHQACDTRENISIKAIDEFSDAAAHVLFVLAKNPGLVQRQVASKLAKGKAVQRSARTEVMAGHTAIR